MKKVVSLVASLLVSSAFSESAFVGFEGDYSFKSNLKIDSDKVGKAQTGLNLMAGYDFGLVRTYGAYGYDFKTKKSYADGEGNKVRLKWTKHSFILGGDYTPNVSENFKLLAGVYAGISRLKADIKSSEDSGKVNFNGVVAGAKFGGIYELDENNAIDFGYKADYTKYSKKYDTNLKETNHGFFAGYTYKF
ncbi:outer membrane beta-barrel protein [Campylobacter gastrosuis]|uniref:Porin family protein n=1 Tax=Campylobacter gastrosuis TaxID=2974576 RepID=A0ABT7HQ15_9BACT|nr:outer membrane beta-barrel protein [Campylobacter gastrosuis]MDL0088930.1 porin family protein [Campylobacter gastrosuis]